MAIISDSVNHVALAVTDMARATQILIDCFGFVERPERRVDNTRMSVAMLGGSSIEVELLYFGDADTRPPMHALTPHLAFDVADLSLAVAALAERGIVLQDDRPTRVLDTQNVWTTPESTAGLVIQLVAPSAEPTAPQGPTAGTDVHS